MKRILIPMVEAGGGHRMPALAIKDSIEKLFPNRYQIDVIDFAKESGAKWDDKNMKEFWDWALAHPELTTNLNILLDYLNHLTRSNAVTPLFFQQFLFKGSKYILKYKPDIVFSTHFFCSSVAQFARTWYGLDYKVFSYMTDPVRGHNLWVNPKVDAVIVSTAEASEYLSKQGEPSNKIKVMSFPLNKKFFAPVTRTRDEILNELGLDVSKQTLLATSGGQGIGKTSEYIKKLYKSDFPYNIIAVCGKNEELMETLKVVKNTVPSKVPIAILGFAHNMHELLEVSDIAIAKGGASTTFELLVKRVPTIFTHCAALHEKGNIDFCVNYKMGWYAKNETEFNIIIKEILNSDILKQYRENIDNNEYVKTLHDASDNLARFIVQELEKPRINYKKVNRAKLRATVLGTRINLYRLRTRNKSQKYKIRK